MSNPADLSNRIKHILNKVHTLSVDNVGYQFLVRDIYNLVNQEIKAEREACAQIADSIKDKRISDGDEVSSEIAKRIRNRND